MQKPATIELLLVHYVPRDLQPGLLYVSEEFGVAMHLCACGCGSKVSTPLGPTEWSIEETPEGPSLSPSIGNWQLPCRSHYLIRSGRIVWADAWSPQQVAHGRKAEEHRRREYHDALSRQRGSGLRRFWRWLRGLLS